MLLKERENQRKKVVLTRSSSEVCHSLGMAFPRDGSKGDLFSRYLCMWVYEV